jgi:hypothetical protein
VGRPALPKGEAKGIVIALRVTEAEMATLTEAAERAGKPISRWARELLLAEASR